MYILVLRTWTSGSPLLVPCTLPYMTCCGRAELHMCYICVPFQKTRERAGHMCVLNLSLVMMMMMGMCESCYQSLFCV